MKLLWCLFFTVLSFSEVMAFDWQGHRGARGIYPENTIGAMKEALKYPVSTLEMDVVISKDQQVVVSHEPWMNPEICLSPFKKNIKSQREINIYQLTYAEIEKYECGTKKYPRFPKQQKVAVQKPLLEKLITEIEIDIKKLTHPINYNIEIKSTVEDEKSGFQPDFKTFTDLVVKKLNTLLPLERYTLQSFDIRVLKYLNQKYPKVRVAALLDGAYVPEEYLKLLGFKPFIFSPNFEHLKASDIKFFHDRKIGVVPWTVNSMADMKKLTDLGVDGIITDFPNLISVVGANSCPLGTNYFEGKCISVPSHAVSSGNNPGWVCKPGYVQKWFHCQKIIRPTHARFLADGKTWVCKPGYVRYRGRCEKGPKK